MRTTRSQRNRERALAATKRLSPEDLKWVLSRINGIQELVKNVFSENLKVIALESCKELFLEKYRIRVQEEDHTVTFFLPEGSSRMDLVNEAASLAFEMYGKKAFSKHCMKRLNASKLFSTPAGNEFRPVIICGYVKDSEQISAEGQCRKGWNNPSFVDLAVAHVINLALNGKDLFNGHPVRTKDGKVMRLFKYGLALSPSDKTYDRTPVAACKLLKAS